MTDTRGQQLLLCFYELRIALSLSSHGLKVVSYFCKHSVVKHSILLAESLRAVKHIAGQIFTRNKTWIAISKGFHPSANRFQPS